MPSMDTKKLHELCTPWPTLGTDEQGNAHAAGGLSGLYIDPTSTPAETIFYSIADNGPNGKKKLTSGETLRVFDLPALQKVIYKFTLTSSGCTLEEIPLKRSDGTPITAIPPPYFQEKAVAKTSTTYPNTDYTDGDGNTYHTLTPDTFGGDFEGILIADGNFWTVDEYGPFLDQFDSTGTHLARYLPSGYAALASGTAGDFGTETLPAVLLKRKTNRGFEAMAYDGSSTIYCFVQSPLVNGGSEYNLRVIGVDKSDGSVVSEHIVRFPDEWKIKPAGEKDGVVDKVGDCVFVGAYAADKRFNCILRDSWEPSYDGVFHPRKYIYELDMRQATNVRSTTATPSRLTSLRAWAANPMAISSSLTTTITGPPASWEQSLVCFRPKTLCCMIYARLGRPSARTSRAMRMRLEACQDSTLTRQAPRQRQSSIPSPTTD